MRAIALAICLIVTSLASARVAAQPITISETADYVPGISSYRVIQPSYWEGAAFSTIEATRITTLGGHLRGDTSGDPIFVAIFPTTDGLPPPPPDVADAVFVQLITPPDNFTDYTLATDFILPAGDWAIVFGTGAAGATGTGGMPVGQTEIDSPTYVTNWVQAWNINVLRDLRFVVKGEPPTCGDGAVNGVEQCDDGNVSNRDECLNSCRSAACGDRFVGPGEDCDDGNTNDGDGCDSACQQPDGTPRSGGSPTADSGGCQIAAGMSSAHPRWALALLTVLLWRKSRASVGMKEPRN